MYPQVHKLLTNLHVTQMQLPSEMVRQATVTAQLPIITPSITSTERKRKLE
jgi:hypothetical protein